MVVNVFIPLVSNYLLSSMCSLLLAKTTRGPIPTLLHCRSKHFASPSSTYLRATGHKTPNPEGYITASPGAYRKAHKAVPDANLTKYMCSLMRSSVVVVDKDHYFNLSCCTLYNVPYIRIYEYSESGRTFKQFS